MIGATIKETTFANVIIFAGQSNNTDMGTASSLAANLQSQFLWGRSFYKPTDDAFDNGGWKYFATGVNSMVTQHVAGKFGSSCTCVDKLFTTYGKFAFAINSSVGNTRLSNLSGAPNWNASISNSYYNRNINQHVIPALRLLPTVNYKIAAYFWSQGENDAMQQNYADEYQVNLIAYIAKVRLDLGLPNLPFIISMMKTSINAGTCPYSATVIAAQNYVIANIANVYGLNNSSETLIADLIHYTDTSYISIGNRLADLINPFCQ